MYKLILFLLLICSCRSAKNQISDQSKGSTIYTGTVHLNNNGCHYYIEINKCLVSNIEFLGKTIYPIQLDDKFKKEGVKLKFNLSLSRAMSPSDCQVDYVVSLENVSVTKK